MIVGIGPGAGKVKAGEVGGVEHLRGGEAGGAGGASCTHCAGLAAGLGVPVAVGDGVIVVVSSQPADVVTAFNAAGGIDVADGSKAVPHQAADVVKAFNAAGSIGVVNGSRLVKSDQPADLINTALNATGGIGVVDGSRLVKSDQPADSA